MSLHARRRLEARFPGRFTQPPPALPDKETSKPELAPVAAGLIPDQPQPSDPAANQARLAFLTDIQHRKVEWLWKDRLPVGALAMISGEPGSGKTWVALAIAAGLSRGHFPEDTSPDPQTTASEPCTVLYASTQDLGSELIRPRFLSLDGDPARLVLLRGSASPSAALSLRDTPILEDAIQRTQARLLIIDPLHGYLGSNDRHRAHEAARIFDNLAQLAEKHRCCVLLIRHLRKRGRGSAAIELSSAVRTEFLVGSSPDAPAWPALVQIKSNLGPLAHSLGYYIDPVAESTVFHWTGHSKLTPEEIQSDRPTGPGLPRRKQAAEWLREQLEGGPMSQGQIETAAHRDGVCIITMRRAKCDIGVISTKSNFNGCWYWGLPPS